MCDYIAIVDAVYSIRSERNSTKWHGTRLKRVAFASRDRTQSRRAAAILLEVFSILLDVLLVAHVSYIRRSVLKFHSNTALIQLIQATESQKVEECVSRNNYDAV